MNNNRTAALAWPNDVHQCHQLLEAMAAQTTAQSKTLDVAKECVAQLEREAASNNNESELEEIKAFLKQRRRWSHKESAEALMAPDAFVKEFHELKTAMPRLASRLRQLNSNEYDRKMENKPTEVWQRNRNLKLHRSMVDLLRDRDRESVFVLSLARSLSIQTQHAQVALRSNLSHEGLLHDEKFLNAIRKHLVDWLPPVDFEVSDELVLVAMDNLDMYSRRSHSRLKDGEVVKSHMVHALVSERILFDKAILKGPAPTGDLLIKDMLSVAKHAALPNRSTVEKFLTGHWAKFRSDVSTCTPMDVLGPPPPQCDRQPGRTWCVNLPLISNRSTASKEDVTFGMMRINELFPGTKKMGVFDYQTFAVAWWVKARGGELFEDWLPVGGELHRQFHSDDCGYRLFWPYVLEPTALWLCRTDIRLAFNADCYNNRESFKRMVAISVFEWLNGLEGEPPCCLDKPTELLEAVHTNLPVWELLKFQLHCGVFALSDKLAMRTTNVPELDFAWGYTSILAHACGKTNYGKYGVLMNLVLHSSQLWCRNVLDHARSYRMSDEPCTGTGLDTAVEHGVRTTKASVQRVSTHRLDTVSIAQTAARECKAQYEVYIGTAGAHRKRRLIDVSEDIKMLVDQFNLSFGTTWTEVTAPKTWSKFANRGVNKADCGGTRIDQIWAGIPAWIEKMTVATDQAPIPALFDPPDVDDVDFYDLTAESDDDDDDDSSGPDGARGAPDSWAKRAAAQWMRTHDKKHGGKEREEQLEAIFERSLRRENLHEKASVAAAAAEEAAELEEVEATIRAEERAAAAAEKDWEVEGLVGRRVDDGVVYYRVKWLDHDGDKNTWEPIKNLKGSEMLITKFEEKFKTCKYPRVYASQYTTTGRKRKR
jgi:hypothetical protein